MSVAVGDSRLTMHMSPVRLRKDKRPGPSVDELAFESSSRIRIQNSSIARARPASNMREERQESDT